MMYECHFTNDPAIADWVSMHLPGMEDGSGFGQHVSLAVTKDGAPVAAVIYHNWYRDAGHCELSAAANPGHNWMTRHVINTVFEYPFTSCQMVLMKHRLDNPIRRMWKRFGGEEVILRRMYGRDRDGAIHTLTKEEWLMHPMRMRDAEVVQ